MSSIEPIKLYSHASGPNPWKVAIILKELGFPYETEFVDWALIKQNPYTDINPNGHVPAITDPNTDITLWESAAIIEYLIDQYDKEGKLTYRKSPEKYYLQQFVYFQMSGQGPYYGQAAWFTNFHHEKLPSARKRYVKEVERVVGVLNSVPEGKKWLVGDKCTYADLVFVTWGSIAPLFFGEEKVDIMTKYPNYHRWMETMMARPAVKAAMEEKAAQTSTEWWLQRLENPKSHKSCKAWRLVKFTCTTGSH